MSNFGFNLEILYNYIFYYITNSFKKDKISIYDVLFSIVVKKNIIFSHSLYKEKYSKQLFSKLIYKIYY